MGLGFESQRGHISLHKNVKAFFMAHVYIIFSAKVNKYYVGACTNLERRLYEHNIGHSTFTSTGIPWVLKYTEHFDSLPEAKNREKEIKNKKSRVYIENLISKR